MDSASMNHYEKQLYTVFKTFDVDNEEALDRCAVLQLCDALQLEDRGSALVNTLFERQTDRVTFAQFRNGLLAVLGGGDSTPVPGPHQPSAPAEPPDLPDPPAPPPAPTPHSDDDSSGREVAPKFVFGSKKYGRRSRPHRAADEPASPRAASASRLDTDDKRARQRMRCRRSASAMESREDSVDVDDDGAPTAYDHDRLIDRDRALAMCRHLRMDGIDRRLIERIFENSPEAETTVGEFFDRLNASLTTSIEAARDERPETADPPRTGDAADDDTGAGLATDLVVDAWERAGVRRPRRLLLELGFASPALRPTDLESALDDELRALATPPDAADEPRAVLLTAALALSRLRHRLARRDADLAAAERSKLRADVAEANRRARLLAQEVDESHARVESELKASLRRAEARHAEVARLAAGEAQAERERAGAERARLEAEATRRGEAEGRARAEAGALRARLREAEERAAAAEERSAAVERERGRLAAEACAAAERALAEQEAGRGAASELARRVEELRRESQALRDRNDELCAELEARARHPPAQAAPAGAAEGANGDSMDEVPGGDLSTELHSVLIRDLSEVEDFTPANEEQKSDHDEVITQFHQILDSLLQSPECGCVALRPLGAPLRRALRHLRDEPPRLAALLREVEASLEQMKGEYDRCEEYWSGKLEEEREAHGEEQRAGDDRLADLVARIADYERCFATERALPPIAESRALEDQYTHLEGEFARHRAAADAELRRRDDDARRLRDRLAALEARPPPPPAPAPAPVRDYRNPAYAEPAAEPTKVEGGTAAAAAAAAARGGGGRCACAALAERCRRLAALAAGEGRGAGAGAGEVRELRARLGRAEAAVRRLHARLAAADLLVKDLYVENCHLAHRPTRPL